MAFAADVEDRLAISVDPTAVWDHPTILASRSTGFLRRPPPGPVQAAHESRSRPWVIASLDAGRIRQPVAKPLPFRRMSPTASA
ncbi:hypothetical protein ACFZDJ_42895 [Streptomyces sp. NPDC007896]|uniref:hypothetical protein n=1 Tax=Streptomyces sp. NPDC007896 TaxID=3364784 RepID=UPI0036E9D5B3